MKREDVMAKVLLGMSREEVIAALGPPNDMGGISRKYKTPSIYKYGEIELFFEPWKTGTLLTIWDEQAETVIATLERKRN